MDYTEEKRKQVDEFLSDPEFRKIVERDIGIPKVTVDWESGNIIFKGIEAVKILKIQDILDASKRVVLQ